MANAEINIFSFQNRYTGAFIGFLFSLFLYYSGKYFIIGNYIFLIWGVTASISVYSFNNAAFNRENAFKSLTIGILFFLLIIFLNNAVKVYTKVSIKEWDFLAFYLFGKVGVSKLNFYDPINFSQIFYSLNLPLKVSHDFIKEIVDVGFWYPPPSMFLFLPLGLLDIEISYISWQSILLIFLFGSIFIICKKYFYSSNHINFDSEKIICTLIFIFLFPKLLSSLFIFSQTNIIFLFFLLLLIQNHNKNISGILIAILFIIKPLAIFLSIYYIVFRKWKVLIYCVITCVFFIFLTLLSLGSDVLISYFYSPPTLRIPEYVYFESINQSLFGWMLRTENRFIGIISFNFVKVLYLIFSLILLIVAVIFSIRISPKSKIISFVIFIPLSLIIYPATLSHYSVFLLPVVIKLIEEKIFKKKIFNIILCSAIFVIGEFSLLLLNFILLFIWIVWSLFSDSQLLSPMPNEAERLKQNGYSLF